MWSWTLTAIGVFGLYVTSTGRAWGWLVSIGLQALWAAYAVTTGQYGFLVAAALYGWVFVRNYLRAKADREAKELLAALDRTIGAE